MSTVSDVSSLSPIAPVDADGLSRALLPFGQSTMLPVESYTSPDVLAWERRNFVAGSWACVGRVEELRGRRCDPARAAGRRHPGAADLRGRRRSARSPTPAGTARTCCSRTTSASTTKSVLCVYHAWTYRLDGSLQGAPGFRDNEFFDKADYGLVPLPATGVARLAVRQRHGDAPVVRGPPRRCSTSSSRPYRAGEARARARGTPTRSPRTGSSCRENYHECYHCPLDPPRALPGVDPDLGRQLRRPGAWVGGTMQFKDDTETMSLDGRSKGRPIEGAPQDSVLYVQLFPNLLISGHPDYVMTHRVLPLAPDRTWIECSWYFPGADIDPTYAVEFWDLTNSPGLARLRARAARTDLAALRARAVRTQRGRRAPVGADDRPRLPRHRAPRQARARRRLTSGRSAGGSPPSVVPSNQVATAVPRTFFGRPRIDSAGRPRFLPGNPGIEGASSGNLQGAMSAPRNSYGRGTSWSTEQ